MKKNFLAAAVSSAALLFAAGAWADGGPVPEAPPPPPPPAPAPEPEPVYEPAPAPEYNWYTTIFAGAVFGDLEITVREEGDPDEAFDIPLETGYLLGWTIGYDNLFGGDTIQFRPEVELSFRQQDVDLDEAFDGDLADLDNISMPTDVLSLLANLWVDFDFGGGFTPYVGGGVGIGWADLPFEFAHVESTDFVWQFGGGVNFDVNERVFAGIGYRYFGGNFEEDLDFIGISVEYEYRTHEVLANLGVRF
jgi:opacity protein-like surface antigen